MRFFLLESDAIWLTIHKCKRNKNIIDLENWLSFFKNKTDETFEILVIQCSFLYADTCLKNVF